MDRAPTKITFFERFEPIIVSGDKTITIRDESESHYVPGTSVSVHTLETDRHFCDITILSVIPIKFDELNEFHAQQEYMALPELKKIIREIYPDIEDLYVISYQLG
ncbi:ASCH domain-containing protein [Shewanella sp. 202IG2-18]|uniref:N(4)-acetylcytidine aminohydrolase n=1 Tax=Parashewanella hymeniacidonis TaxID=2807618 RepID=UPI00195FAF52|nr:N(4)-acetylcytidine aminohydrolase [Parashewanella hymeniacidonis]MBM7071216.1 ASCH domain-containing protein [Parashewanella hymeniacidonis]